MRTVNDLLSYLNDLDLDREAFKFSPWYLPGNVEVDHEPDHDFYFNTYN